MFHRFHGDLCFFGLGLDDLLYRSAQNRARLFVVRELNECRLQREQLTATIDELKQELAALRINKRKDMSSV
jgi:hypothetical protein